MAKKNTKAASRPVFHFSNAQIQYFKQNPLTQTATERTLVFQPAFEEKFDEVFQRTQSVPCTFQELGYDPYILGLDFLFDYTYHHIPASIKAKMAEESAQLEQVQKEMKSVSAEIQALKKIQMALCQS